MQVVSKVRQWMMSIRKKTTDVCNCYTKLVCHSLFFHTLYTYGRTESFIREGNVFPRAFLNRGEDTCRRRSTDCQFTVQYNGTKHHRTVLTNGENEFLYTKIIYEGKLFDKSLTSLLSVPSFPLYILFNHQNFP